MKGLAIAASAVLVLIGTSAHAQQFSIKTAPTQTEGSAKAGAPEKAPAPVAVGVSLKALPAAEQAKFTKASAAAGLDVATLQKMDPKSAMLALQAERGKLLEKSLKSQLAVSQKNGAQMGSIMSQVETISAKSQAEKDPARQAAYAKELEALQTKAAATEKMQQAQMADAQKQMEQQRAALEAVMKLMKEMQEAQNQAARKIATN